MGEFENKIEYELIDPYGLTMKLSDGTVINRGEETSHDDDLLFDSLQLFKYLPKVESYMHDGCPNPDDTPEESKEIRSLLSGMSNKTYGRRVNNNAGLIDSIVHQYMKTVPDDFRNKLDVNKAKDEVKEFPKTPYDTLVIYDALTFIKYLSKIEDFMDENILKKNEETGLYDVTVGEVNTAYYAMATMLNRMTNKTYADKVYYYINRINSILKPVIYEYTDTNEEPGYPTGTGPKK